jgi:hypothetical protein
MSGFRVLVKTSFGDIPTTEIPLFEVLGKEITAFEGGVNITLTFRNYGCDAPIGNVWINWEKVWYGSTLIGSPPAGNITESILDFDVNGDGDESDWFAVNYIDNKTVEVGGVTANAIFIPEQRIYYDDKGIYDVLEKNSFTLGSKNHTVTRVRYMPDYGVGYAGFGLESFFRDHPCPNIEFAIDQKGSSINSTSRVEIISMELNGILTPYEFNWSAPWVDYDEQWYLYTSYVYPLNFLSSGAVFTVRISIQGEPGSYLLTSILNWAPDVLHRYRYFVFPFEEIPFAITGTIHRTVDFGGKTYHIEVFTNSTVSPTITFDPNAKEICFNATSYSEHGGSTYFWNITIPQDLLSDNPWNATLDGASIPFSSTNNGTHTFLYFSYTDYTFYGFITSRISIKGTWAVPESPSWIVLPLFMVVTLLASILYRRKQSTQLQIKSS